MNKISVLIFNEELHIERCINSLKTFAKDIFIVDSFSKARSSKFFLFALFDASSNKIITLTIDNENIINDVLPFQFTE